MKKLVGYSVVKTGEGLRINAVFTILDDEGNIVDTNKNENFIVVDKTIEGKINEVEKFIVERNQ